MKPLLELVNHKQDLLRAATSPFSSGDQGVLEVEVGGKVREVLPQPSEQSGLGLPGGRLHVDGDHALCESWQQSGFDQGRLAATARSEDHAHREGLLRVGLLDADLPEVDALGEPVGASGAGEQFEEEIGVVLVEGSQALGDDPDLDLVPGPGGRRRRFLRILGQFLTPPRRDCRLERAVDQRGEIDVAVPIQSPKAILNRPQPHPGLPGDVGIEDEPVAISGQFVARREDQPLRSGGHGCLRGSKIIFGAIPALKVFRRD